MSNKIIIYHNHCSDGLGASHSFYKKYPDAQFYAAMHDGSAPPDVAGKEVFIVDFCYSPEILLEMKKAAKSIIVLDHHKSAMERCGFSSDPGIMGGEVVFAGTRLSVKNIAALLSAGEYEGIKKDYPEITDEQLELAQITCFDMKRSGAGMAWDYLNPGKERPWICAYTEDKDLWKFALPNSREVNAALQSYPLTFETLDMLSARKLEDLVVEGATILRANQNMIDTIVKKAYEIEICGYMVPIVNSPVLQSEIGNYLSKNRPFAVVYFINELGEKVLSLRSDKNGVDVSKIAQEIGNKFGTSAGGHYNASGTRLKVGQSL